MSTTRPLIRLLASLALAFTILASGLGVSAPAGALEPADGGFNQKAFHVGAGWTVDITVPAPWGRGSALPICLIDGYHAAGDDDMGWSCVHRWDARQNAYVFTVRVFGASTGPDRYVTGTATVIGSWRADLDYTYYDASNATIANTLSGHVESVAPGPGEVVLNTVAYYHPQGNDDFGFRFGANRDGEMELRIGPAPRPGKTESGRIVGWLITISDADRLSWTMRDADGDRFEIDTRRRTDADRPTLCLASLEGLGSTSMFSGRIDKDFSVHARPTGGACGQIDDNGRRTSTRSAPVWMEFWSDDGNASSIADVGLVLL